MNDNDLIDELRDGMRARTNNTEVPDGFVDRARRTARRRSSRRAAAVCTPVLAAVAVATVLATGAGSSSPSGAQAPSVTVGTTQAHDTAYVVKRVEAKIAGDSCSTLLHVYEVPRGQETSSGSLLDLSRHSFDEYVYDSPDGGQYQRTASYNQDGNLTALSFWKIYTAADGKQTLAGTRIDPAKHTYTTSHTLTGGGATIGATVPHGESEVQRALKSGRVTQMGTTTINGTPAIALSLKQIRVGSRVISIGATGYTETLYVDAQTFQLLSMVAANPTNNPRYFHGLYIGDYLPVTPATIAKAEDESIPAGYAKVNGAN